MLSKRRIIGIGLVTISAMSLLAFAAIPKTKFGLVFGDSQPIYTCGSVKFGHKDANEKQTVQHGVSTDVIEINNYYTTDIDGIILTPTTKINENNNEVTTIYGSSKDIVPIKFASGNFGGELVITLPTNCVGCTIYALGYNKDKVTVNVNNPSISLKTNITANGDYSFDSYYVPLAATNIVTISSAKSNRFFLSNVSFRLV